MSAEIRRAVAPADAADAEMAAKMAALEIAADVAVETRSSSGGRYLSHRLSAPVKSAEDVLQIYARLRAIEGVITVL